MNASVKNIDADPETIPAFQPFSWVSPEGAKFPGARLAERTKNISQGIAMVLEMIEHDGLSKDCAGMQRLMTGVQNGVMLRFAVAAAQSLAEEAENHCNWVEKQGASWQR